MQSRAFSGLPVIGLLTLVYFIAGKFGLLLASLHASASPVWPPAGIALAALLLLGYRAWPAIFVGAFLVNVTTAGNVVTSLAVASGNTLEAVCGAWLVNRFAGGTTVFDRPQGVFKFALVAVVSAIISPALGVTSLALAGFADWTKYGAIWLTWWLGDTTGDLLIAPLIILWSIASKRRWNGREAVEVGILLLLLFVLSEAVFGGWLTISARNYPIGLISGPIVIWMAFRFTQRETATGIFILSAIAIWGTLHGFGPFVGEAENQSLLALQSWTAVLTITAMALSAGMAERGRAQQGLRDSEERMSLVLDGAHIGLWELDVIKGELWGTKTRRALLGFPASGKLTLEDVLSRTHVDDRDRLRQALKDAIETGKDYDCEYRVILPDGNIRWMEQRGRCVSDADGKTVALLGISMDVTQRKQAQDLFRLATEASPNAIVVVNDRGRIALVNAHVEELFGYRREELIGKLVDILVPERFAGQHPAHRAQFLAAPTARPMGAGRELFARRKDGSEFPVEIGLNPIQTPEGILVLAAGVDISARKFAEAEAMQHQAQLGHLSRVAVMGELAASIAHELNQPLSGIISNAGAGQRFIERGDVNLGELRELLGDIIADGRRAGDVIRGVRSMVKKDALIRQQVDLNKLVMSVVRMLNSDAMLHSCVLETMLEPNLPAVEANPSQLQQVLINLVINAFDAMRSTALSRRRVVIATERNGDGAVCTSVRDYGVGIPDEVRDRLFDHFFTTKAEGLGMGLGIVRSVVESHGGTVAAENIEGGGARFSFSIPAEKGASK